MSEGQERWFPPRPDIPLVLSVALCVWIGCATSLSAARGVDETFCRTIALIAAIVAFAVLVVAFRAPHKLLCCAVLGLSLGCALGMMQAGILHFDQRYALEEPGGLHTFLVTQDASEGEFGSYCFAEMSLQSGRSVCVRVNLPDDFSVH